MSTNAKLTDNDLIFSDGATTNVSITSASNSLIYTGTTGSTSEVVISGVATPLLNNDSANKAYVDANSGAGGAITNVQFNNPSGSFDGVGSFTFTAGTSAPTLGLGSDAGTTGITTLNVGSGDGTAATNINLGSGTLAATTIAAAGSSFIMTTTTTQAVSLFDQASRTGAITMGTGLTTGDLTIGSGATGTGSTITVDTTERLIVGTSSLITDILATGTAGVVNITSGGSTSGGNITVTTGNGTAGAGGSFIVNTGTGAGGSSTGGIIDLNAGAGLDAGDAGGTVTINAGVGSSTTTGGAGGDLTVIAGAAQGTGANAGGIVNITAGVATSTGIGGDVNISSGAAASGTGGSVIITAAIGSVADGDIKLVQGGETYIWPTTAPTTGQVLEVSSYSSPTSTLGWGDTSITASEYLQVKLGSDDTTFPNASAVTFDTTIVNSGSISNSSGVFTLQLNKTYRLTGRLGINTTSSGVYYQWRNITGAALIGIPGNTISVDNSTSDSSTNDAVAIFTPTGPNLTVHLEIISGGSSTTLEADYCMALIEKIADNSAITEFGGATAGVDGSIGYVPAPLAGEEGEFLRGDGTWSNVSMLALPDTQMYVGDSGSSASVGTTNLKYDDVSSAGSPVFSLGGGVTSGTTTLNLANATDNDASTIESLGTGLFSITSSGAMTQTSAVASNVSLFETTTTGAINLGNASSGSGTITIDGQTSIINVGPSTNGAINIGSSTAGAVSLNSGSTIGIGDTTAGAITVDSSSTITIGTTSVGTTLTAVTGGVSLTTGTSGKVSVTSAAQAAVDTSLGSILEVQTQTLSHNTATTFAESVFTSFAAPTINNVSGTDIVTQAATVAIAGSPINTGSGSITNTHALWVQSGNAHFEEQVQTNSIQSTHNSGTINLYTETSITTLNLGTGVTTGSILNISTSMTDGSINIGTSMTSGTITIGSSDTDVEIIYPRTNFSAAGSTTIVNKGYVDAIATGLSWKESVRASTTTNLTSATYVSGATTITTAPQSIDSVTLVLGDRLLVKDSVTLGTGGSGGTDTANGIYEITTLGTSNDGVWTRTSDMPVASDASGDSMLVEEGTTNGDKAFVCTNNTGSALVGTDTLVFALFSGGAGTASGPEDSVQFNTSNTFTGSSNFTWDDTTLQLGDSKNFTVGVGDELVMTHSGSVGVGSITNSTGTFTINNTAAASDTIIKLGDIAGATSLVVQDSASTPLLDIASNGAISMTDNLTMSKNIATITHTGTTTLSIASTSGSVNIESVNFAGGIVTNATTINASGAITGGTLTDGAFSVTSGAITGVTTFASSDKLTLTGTDKISTTSDNFNGDGNINTLGDIVLNGTTSNTIAFRNQGIGGPTLSSRSSGTKIVLFPAIDVGGVEIDFAIGISSNRIWHTVPSAADHAFYTSTNLIAKIDSSGLNLEDGKSVIIGSGTDLTITHDGTTAGSITNTTGDLSISSTAGAITVDSSSTINVGPTTTGAINVGHTLAGAVTLNSGSTIGIGDTTAGAITVDSSSTITIGTTSVGTTLTTATGGVSLTTGTSGHITVTSADDGAFAADNVSGTILAISTQSLTTTAASTYDIAFTGFSAPTIDATLGTVDNASTVYIGGAPINGGGTITTSNHLGMGGSTSGTFGMTVPSTVTDYGVTWPAAVAGGTNYSLTSNSLGTLAWTEPPGDTTWKTGARVATVEAIDLASAPATIDGITMIADDRVLVKNQTQTWTSRTYPSSSNNLNGIIWVDDLSLFVGAGFQDLILNSTDGVTWTTVTGFGRLVLESIAWSPIVPTLSSLVAGSGYTNGTQQATVVGGTGTGMTLQIVVTGGAIDSAIPTESGTNYTVGDVLTIVEGSGAGGTVTVSSIGLLVVVGAQSNTGKGISPDGTNWTLVNGTGIAFAREITWSPELGLFCEAGSSGTVATSPTGHIWTTRTTPLTTLAGGISWSPELSIFVILSDEDVTNGAIVSSDGINWISYTTPQCTWRDVVWSPELGIFCACADGGTASTKIMTSPDGITWTGRTHALSTSNGITWSPELGVFIAVTASSYQYSSDGITWTNGSGGGGNRITWSSKFTIFATVGQSSSINTGTPTDNGIYSWNGTSSTMTRTTDTVLTTASSGVGVYISDGAVNTNRLYFCISPGGSTFGTNSVFSEYSKVLPGGDQEVQFNDGGKLAGSPKMLFDKNSGDLILNGTVAVLSDLSVNGNANIGSSASSVNIKSDDVTIGISLASSTINMQAKFMGISSFSWTGGQGSQGGSTSGGVWNTRSLNTANNSNTDILNCTLSGNNVILPAGTYVANAMCKGWRIGRNKIRLYDTTGSNQIVLGSNGYDSGSNASLGGGSMIMDHPFTISVSSAILLQQYTERTKNTDGQGVPNNASGVNEVYSALSFQRIY